MGNPNKVRTLLRQIVINTETKIKEQINQAESIEEVEAIDISYDRGNN